MRLDDFDPNINVEDQRGNSGGGGFGFGGGGGGLGGGGGGLIFSILPLIGSRFGCGGIAVVLLLLAVFGGLGNLGSMVGGGSSVAPTQQAGRAGTDTRSSCTMDANSRVACNVFSSADKTWAGLFQQAGKPFQQPKLVFYGDQGGQSGCGAAQAAMGPFYCPSDDGIYLDTNFFDELQSRFHAGGDFAQDYVVAHEFGHHIQNLLGTSTKVSQAQAQGSRTEGNAMSVRLELQADCFAGVWAAANRDRIEPGDVEEGLRAAQAIGDDTLQRESQGRVVPDSFTHGTSAQRQKWLQRGMTTGDPEQCDTFSGAI